jgi:hypothetical protein
VNHTNGRLPHDDAEEARTKALMDVLRDRVIAPLTKRLEDAERRAADAEHRAFAAAEYTRGEPVVSRIENKIDAQPIANAMARALTEIYEKVSQDRSNDTLYMEKAILAVERAAKAVEEAPVPMVQAPQPPVNQVFVKAAPAAVEVHTDVAQMVAAIEGNQQALAQVVKAVDALAKLVAGLTSAVGAIAAKPKDITVVETKDGFKLSAR